MNKKNIIRKIFLPFLLTVCLLTTPLAALPQETGDGSRTLTYTYSFTRPVVEKVTTGERSFDAVHVEGLHRVGQYGEPIIPVKELRLLLPYQYRIDSIEATPSEPLSLGFGYVLEPGGRDIPLTTPVQTLPPSSNDEMYLTSELFPGCLFDTIGTYGFRGYQILYLTLYPVHYHALTGELLYYPELIITLHLDKDETLAIHELYRDCDADKNNLRGKVDTIQGSETYPSLQKPTRDDYDLLIITTDALKTSFEPLADIHTSQGLPTMIATLSDIGSTDPEAIRSYIRNAYQTMHIDYVLLGGDADVVPARLLWVTSGYGDTDELPADLYYGCLDGTYNYDGDDRWGEPFDGEGGGDVDLIAEVYVGRACVGDSSEVDNFIQKTVGYIYTNDSYLDKALMVGEFLWEDPDTWGGDYMDELIDGSSAHAYTTVGVPSANYTIETLYDRDWPSHDWPKEEIINRINDNVHLINHLGHSWYDYNMKMNNDDVDALTNTRYFFAYSQGCDNGGFDNPLGYDCIAEHFTVKTEHGAFAVVGNARYGFGASGSTDGANQRYHRQFIDAIFGEGLIQLGRANQDSKEDNIHQINQKVMRWCYYEINLFGDPTIDFFAHYTNSPPDTPEAPSGPTDGEVGVNYTYTLHANMDPEGDQTYYKFYWADGETSEWLGPYNPSEIVSTIHAWKNAGVFDVMVKCRDSYWGMSNYSDVFPVTITGPFFEIGTITGGLLQVSADITNVGAGAATNVKRSITIEGVRNKRIFIVTNSTLDLLGSGESTLAQTDKPVLGFGKVTITAAAWSPGGPLSSKTVDGFVLFCFVFIVK